MAPNRPKDRAKGHAERSKRGQRVEELCARQPRPKVRGTSPPKYVVCPISSNNLAAQFLQQLLSEDSNLNVVRFEDLPNSDPLLPVVFLIDSSVLPLGECLRTLRKRFSVARFLALDHVKSHEQLVGFLVLGVHGFLSYEEASGCLLQATNAIAAGGLHFPPLVLERYVQSAFSDRHSSHTMLTVRENQVMELAERRFSNKEIAAVLHIRCTTVRYHMSNIFSKLNISNRKMLVQRHEYDPNSGERAFDELRRVTLANGASDSNPGVSQGIIQRNTIRTSA